MRQLSFTQLPSEQGLSLLVPEGFKGWNVTEARENSAGLFDQPLLHHKHRAGVDPGVEFAARPTQHEHKRHDVGASELVRRKELARLLPE
mgnify:CR=1 FL=1